MRILVLTRYPEQGASSRYCVLQYLPWLESHGFQCDSWPLYSNSLYRALLRPGSSAIKAVFVVMSILKRIAVVLTSFRYDLVLMHREALPIGPPFLERLLRRRGIPIVFTYDDALFIFKSNAVNRTADWFKRPGKYFELFSIANCVVASNPWLRDAAAEHCADARYLPAAENLGRLGPKNYEESGSSTEVILGWIGSPSTEKYLRLIGDVLAELCSRHPEVRLRIVGGNSFRHDGIPVEHCPWTMEGEAGLLHSFDIGLMPLPDEDWSKGKSGGKARTYMAAALPCVCTRIGFNEELIVHGETGFLAVTKEDWLTMLEALVSSRALRQQTGLAARRYIEDNLSLDAVAPRLMEILKETAGIKAQ